MLEDLIIEVLDQLDARRPRNAEQLEDMMSEELDKYPELADTKTADWVKEIIREHFTFYTYGDYHERYRNHP